MSPANGQPYRLHLLSKLAESWGDPDLALLPFLQEGVPTGALSPLPCSLQCRQSPQTPSQRQIWNFAKATGKRRKKSPKLCKLLDKEISNNWVVATDLTVAEAQRKWPLGVAIGKLNVVFAENNDPRLVLDSTVCQVNTRCYLPERVSLPMASNLALATQPMDTPGAFIGASVDFKAAHKQVQVRLDERGLLLFAFKNKLYHYRVCNFGGLLSGYWWQRTGAFLLPPPTVCWHGSHTNKAFLFVDDLVCALIRARAPEMFALVDLFFLRRRRADLLEKSQIPGFIQLMKAKLVKLEAFITTLLGRKRCLAKRWSNALACSSGLRSWMAPLYADLNSPLGSMRSIQPQMWPTFRKSLNKDLKTCCSSLPSLWISAGSKILEIAGRTVRCLEDIPRIPGTSKPTWFRIADPNNPFTTLSKASQICFKWLGCGNLDYAGCPSGVAQPCQACAALHRLLRDASATSAPPSHTQPYWWRALLV